MTWTTRQRFNTDNGLAGYKAGHGPALVLLHGVGLRAETWNGICDRLQQDYTVYAIDLPGHGESLPINSDTPDLTQYADIIATYLGTFNGQVYLAGHSMGAMIALDIAIRYPGLVKKVAALNAIYCRSGQAIMDVQDRADALMSVQQGGLNTSGTIERWFGKAPIGDALQAAQACDIWLRETQIAAYRKAYRVFSIHDGPSKAGFAALKAPALFVTGANEPNSTPKMSRAMAKIAPDGLALIIDGAAHMMPMTHAAQVATALTHHFKG